ncbi:MULTISPECIES: electron transfer flavoprotein subunit beta/FixA family protein [Paenibacillus]|uniref:Electron transfer flavoprotein subunit beta n=1 Tax=Paenibacillus campinasensis TaxID=66347 RepID=A0A268EG77_9BACL|nr:MULTISPECIES: electron transfer flavoprotein subunit beta/FixA family protein [Paenibacillus]PAD72126.1 electron transfer flavoprotein subunit beta [Paenibacillus campinasensis]PAK49063.1 electron transfer flavoprotein subunit beta [Paenibacillus sp. 7541]
MKIVVLLKQTFDTEERIEIDNGSIAEDGVKFVINPYDEYAVEEAVKLRDEAGGSVTLLSVGPDRTVEALRTALAMGADDAVLISDARIPDDEHAVSKVLHAYLATAAPDLILGGNFSVDRGSGQVAIRLAQLLGFAHAGSITKLAIRGTTAEVHRDAEGDLEVLEVQLPAVFTAQQGLNEPRYPSLPGIMKAKKKPLQTLTLDDLGLSEDDVLPATRRSDLSLPPERSAGRMLKGEPAEVARELVTLLRTQSKVI